MISETEEKIYQLKSLSALSQSVVRKYIKKEYLPLYDGNLQTVLNQYKHDLFHLCYNVTPCCECPQERPQLHRDRQIHYEQFKKLYKGDGISKHEIVETTQRGTTFVSRHCLCKFKASASLDLLDLPLMFILLEHCFELKNDIHVNNWIATLRQVRNFVSHIGSFNAYDVSEFDTKIKDIEYAMIKLANLVSSTEGEYKMTVKTKIGEIKVHRTEVTYIPQEIERNQNVKINMISETEEKIYQLKSLSALSQSVVRKYIKKEYLPLYDGNLQTVLNQYKHDLFHLCYNVTPCCECPQERPQLHRDRQIHYEQFKKLYKGDGISKHEIVETTQRGTTFVSRHCLCKFKANASLDLLDLPLMIILLEHCFELKNDIHVNNWIATLRQVRNFVSHIGSFNAYDVSEIDTKIKDIEYAMIKLANLVSSTAGEYKMTVKRKIGEIKVHRTEVTYIPQEIERNQNVYNNTFRSSTKGSFRRLIINS
ncbi:uncharacterized protein LOC127702349 isoform X2 [Mytilus californianus]|uniref:uncharacterized protein LOC127702349 isoform X2 n=1 Tax=Mytilus californianus TaxID=6549 RepID=UPI002248448C|nr:uncharacterized protein LOC127702349 isoform X2 [Mytilus californianus]